MPSQNPRLLDVTTLLLPDDSSPVDHILIGGFRHAFRNLPLIDARSRVLLTLDQLARERRLGRPSRVSFWESAPEESGGLVYRMWELGWRDMDELGWHRMLRLIGGTDVMNPTVAGVRSAENHRLWNVQRLV